MSNKNKLIILEKRKSELVRHIHTCAHHKKKIAILVQDLSNQYDRDRISYREYSERLRHSLDQKTPEQWIVYYDEKIKDYNEQIDIIDEEIRREENKSNIAPLAIIFAVLVVLGIGVYYLQPTITGLIIGENITIEDNVTEEQVIIETEEQVIIETEKEIEEESLLQGIVEINKPVKWIKRIKLKESADNLTIKLSDKVSNVKVSKIVDEFKEEIKDDKLKVIKEGEIKPIALTGYIVKESEINEDEIGLIIDEEVEEVEIEYYTEGPGVIEKEIDISRKEIIIYSEIHYENILAHTSIKEVNKDLIKLYKTTNGIRELTEITDYVDNNNNKLINEIKWIVPSLSNETYEVVIEISKAEHLDSERNFISDIYVEVKELDGIWSEEILDTHYVRVTFEQNLTSDKDITIYPHIISGSPKIEVYEVNGNDLISEFTFINSNEYNKVFLTNLQGRQDTFDLRVVDGSVKIEYIIDPAFVTGGEAHDVVFAPLNSTTGMFVRVWCQQVSTTDASYYQVLYTNGSAYDSAKAIDTTAGDSCRVGVAALNSTAFSISHIEWVSGSSDWEILGRNIDGNSLWALTEIDLDMNSYVDIDTCALSSTNYISNVIDDTDNDATFVIYNLGSSVKAQTDLDTGVAMDAGVLDQDVVSCTTLSSNSWVFAYYDDNPDQIAYAMYDGAGTVTKALSAVDASDLDGAVSTATLANGGFVIAYCDSTDDDVSFVTYDSSGNSISGIIDINETIQDCSGAAGTHIDVAALNTTDSQFVVAYDNTLYDKVYFAIHNHSGAEILNSQFVENSDTAEKSVAVSSYDYITGNELCQYESIPVFLIAYNNVTDAVWKTYYSDGTEWDGICEFSPEANNAPNTPINVIINSTGESQTNYTTEDLRMNFYCDDNDASDVLTYHLTTFKDGVNQFQLQSNCNDPEYKSILMDSANTTEGEVWSFSVNVSDDSGDYSAIVSTINNITIRDSTPPIVTINSPQNISYYTSVDLPLTFNVSLDKNGSVIYSLDGGFNNITMYGDQGLFGTNFNGTNSSINDGSYTFFVYANDTSGNANYTSYVIFTVETVNITINANIINALGENINATVAFYNIDETTTYYNETTNETHEGIIPIGEYNINVIPYDIGVIKAINFKEVNISNDITEIVNVDQPEDTGNFSVIYAIEPLLDEFKNATVKVNATGNSLYKCTDWNFTDQRCGGEWTLFKTGLIPGEIYSFIIGPGDPGFGEINITHALHLNENLSFISDIYNEAYQLDDVWSETIHDGEYVRVTFQQNLTNENDITIYPRTISGSPRIEVYEFNETEVIAEFEPINDEQYNTIFLSGLIENQSRFDLKILEGEIQFDHIVDPFIATLSTTAMTFPKTEKIVKDPKGALHMLYKDNGNDAKYYNSTDGGNIWTTWATDMFTGTASSGNMLIKSNGDMYAIWTEAAQDIMVRNLTVGSTWSPVYIIINGNATNAFVAVSAVMDSNDVIHMCFVTSAYQAVAGNQFLGYTNWSLEWGIYSDGDLAPQGEYPGMWVANVATNDNDDCDIDVDSNNNIFIVSSGTDEDDVDIWSSKDNFVTRKEIHASTGNQFPAIAINPDDNRIHVAWELGSDDLGYGTATSDGWLGTWATATVDAASSDNPDIKVSKNNQTFITYHDQTTSARYIYLANKTNGNGWQIRRVLQQQTGWNVEMAPSMRGSNNPSFNRITNRIEYVWFNDTADGLYVDWFDVFDLLTPSISNARINNTGVSINTYVKVNATINDTEENIANITLQVKTPSNVYYNISVRKSNYGYYNDTNYEYYNDTIFLDEAGQWTFTLRVNDTYSHEFGPITAQDASGNSYIEVTGGGNQAPNNPAPTINSTFATNLSAQDLHVSFTPSDPDAGETLTYDIWAFENGSRLLFNINNLPATQDILKVFTIDFENTTKGSNYSAQIRVCDDSAACSAYVNTSQLKILNTGPQITNVSINSAWSVTVNGNTSAFFSFSVRDDDNYTDINSTNILANFSRGGETTRYNNTNLDGGCKQSGNFGKYIANYSCTINIVFYDGAGDWNISLMLNDLSFNYTMNKTVTFNLAETTSFSMTDSTFSFPGATPNQYNITASDAIYMNNTGNDDINASSMNITALNIHGDTLGATFIPAYNFTVANGSIGITDSCDISKSGVYRLTNKTIAGTTAFNSTRISGTALTAAVKPYNEQTLFLCLLHTPSDLTTQIYSTNSEEDWSIIIN